MNRGITMMAMQMARGYVAQYEAGEVGLDVLQAHAAEFAQCEVVPQGASGKWYRFNRGALEIRDDAPPYARWVRQCHISRLAHCQDRRQPRSANTAGGRCSRRCAADVARRKPNGATLSRNQHRQDDDRVRARRARRSALPARPAPRAAAWRPADAARGRGGRVVPVDRAPRGDCQGAARDSGAVAGIVQGGRVMGFNASARDINMRLCDALGIDPKDVYRVTIELTPDALPKVTVFRYLHADGLAAEKLVTVLAEARTLLSK